MNLTNNELQKIRSMYPELSDIIIQDAPPKLLNAVVNAKQHILSFCENATIPENLHVYTGLSDIYTTWNNSTVLTSACAIILDEKFILIVSPSIVESFCEEQLIALLIHELIHLTSKAEVFMDSLTEEAFTEICSIAIQTKFMFSPNIPYVGPEYAEKVSEVTAEIEKSDFDIEYVVNQFLDNRTNRSFIKNNFPQMYQISLADIFADLFG